MYEFQFTSYEQDVIFAPGALTRLDQAVERFGWRRIMLCTNHTLSASGRAAALADVLGGRLAAVYDRVKPHVQDFQVAEALQLAVENEVDALIGMGGGSPIGMAKALAPRLAEQRSGLSAPAVIAIPTTYSGSEMTPVYGITHAGETPPRKVTASDPQSAPRLVVYDPQLILDLPPEMTASTGINALAHCFEALYSIKRNPLSSAAATAGVSHISANLLRCYQHPDDLQARSTMLTGSHLASLCHWPAWRWACTMACVTCWAGQRTCPTASPTVSSCRTPSVSTPIPPRPNCSQPPRPWAYPPTAIRRSRPFKSPPGRFTSWPEG
jgi:maleylacetate reductase